MFGSNIYFNNMRSYISSQQAGKYSFMLVWVFVIILLISYYDELRNGFNFSL